ncbi:MAG: SGNH/GDSL hydrolase family protein [Phycisphaerales bacterium]|nr:SGNH/GDSL hydrolase family protein [Phycisphaerales bacterium]
MGRRPWVIAAVAVFLLAGSSQAGINILFYGNSFTLGSGSTRSVDALVNDIALAAGQADPYTLSAAVSGQSLSYHLAYNTAVISSGLPAGQTWDYVVLQDYSTQPTHLGSVAVHRADFAAMYQTVAAHSPDVKVIGFETWARAPGHSFYTGATPSFPGGPAQMQAELREGYALSTADVNALAGAGTSRVAPVGDAWESTGWNNLHYTDLYHANNRGTLLAALVIYGTIYRDDVGDIDLTAVTESLAMPGPYGTYLAGVADQFITPEPASLSLLLAGAGVVLRRRTGRPRLRAPQN